MQHVTYRSIHLTFLVYAEINFLLVTFLFQAFAITFLLIKIILIKSKFLHCGLIVLH